MFQTKANKKLLLKKSQMKVCVMRVAFSIPCLAKLSQIMCIMWWFIGIAYLCACACVWAFGEYNVREFVCCCCSINTHVQLRKWESLRRCHFCSFAFQKLLTHFFFTLHFFFTSSFSFSLSLCVCFFLSLYFVLSFSFCALFFAIRFIPLKEVNANFLQLIFIFYFLLQCLWQLYARYNRLSAHSHMHAHLFAWFHSISTRYACYLISRSIVEEHRRRAQWSA